MQISKYYTHPLHLVKSRTKRFADSAQNIARSVTEELDQMEQKNEVSIL